MSESASLPDRIEQAIEMAKANARALALNLDDHGLTGMADEVRDQVLRAAKVDRAELAYLRTRMPDGAPAWRTCHLTEAYGVSLDG